MTRRHNRLVGGLAVLAFVLAAASLAVAVLVRPGDSTPQAVPTTPPPPPEVLPAARTDAPVPDPARVAEVLEPVLDTPGAGRITALVVDALTGTVLYARDPDVPMIPASTTKLVTAAAALHELGPAHRFATVVVAGDEEGEVVLVGGGDPTLAAGEQATYPDAARLDELAEAVREALGGAPVRRVTVDASLFDGPVYGSWDADIPTGGFVGPVTALMTDGARQDPTQRTGPALRFTEPDLAAGRIFAEHLGLSPKVVERGTAPPPPVQVGSPAPAGSPVPPGATPGEAVGGWPAPGTELARVWSPPLIRVVEIMLEVSDNVIAEALARHVAIARGEPPTFEGGAAAVAKVLADLGVPLGDGALADGSGLSRGNRLSASLLVDLQRAALSDPALAGMFSGLPVAGWSGTLAERYRTSAPDGGDDEEVVAGPGAGVVRAKTGTLFGVTALSGLVVTADGRLLVFALLANDAPETTRNLLDRSAAVLAGCGCR